MKKLLTLLFAVALGPASWGQSECGELLDSNQDGFIGVEDLMNLLSLFGDTDADLDGIWDSVDDCVGVYDACGVCGGTGEDVDNDGLCDDVDDCLGAYDECGVCNGPGPSIPIIDEIIYATDSVFLEPLDEWYVFEFASDTLFTYVCPVSGCMDPEADNFNPAVNVEDGSCAYGPVECGGASTVTYDGYTYDLVAIGDQCWFAENLRTEVYQNGDPIPSNLSDYDWQNTSSGASSVYGVSDIPCTSLVPNSDACDESWSLVNYGRLYNWYASIDNRLLCPVGWHVPSKWELSGLVNMVGADTTTTARDALASQVGWQWNPGSNSSGFNFYPAGYLFPQVTFLGAGTIGYLWTTSEILTPEDAPCLAISQSYVSFPNNDKNNGYSVRCLKDTE